MAKNQVSKGSASFMLDIKDFKKIGKGFLIAAAGAGLTYLLEVIPSVDFGVNSLYIVPIACTIVNSALKWVSNNS